MQIDNKIYELDYSVQVQNKIIYNNLNLDYPINEIDYENQTNKTISKIMNKFIHIYKNDFNKKIFILESQDDIYSLIAYNILKNIQGLFHFNLKVYGKRKYTRKYISRKEIINNFKLKRIEKNNIVYISCFNPIYKVKNDLTIFKNFSNNIFNIIEKFTPSQFVIMAHFYNINNQKLMEEFIKDYFISFQYFTTYPNIYQDINKLFSNEYFKKILNTEQQVYLIKLEGNEQDFILFDSILKKDKGIFLYFFNKENTDFLKSNLNFYIEPRNIIDKNNTNNFILAQNFLKSNAYINYLGNWTEEEKEIWRRLK